nr:immunoglobulin light chain junction region [Mus musculus]
CQQSNSFRTF